MTEGEDNACPSCGRHRLDSAGNGVGMYRDNPVVLPSRIQDGRPRLGGSADGDSLPVRRRDVVPGTVEIDHALTLFVIACGCAGIGILLVLLTHLVTALAALVPAGVGLTLKMTRK
jgi:hypothetical protein